MCQATAREVYNDGLAAAGDAWSGTEVTAWTVYFGAKTDADTALVTTENTAWSSYVGFVNALQPSLVAAEAAAQTEFDSRVTAAFSAWKGAELTAWISYTTGLANLPAAAAQRAISPAAVEIPALVAFTGLQLQVRQEPVQPAVPTTVQFYMPLADDPLFVAPAVVDLTQPPPLPPAPPPEPAPSRPRLFRLVGRRAPGQPAPVQPQNLPVYINYNSQSYLDFRSCPGIIAQVKIGEISSHFDGFSPQAGMFWKNTAFFTLVQ